MKILIEHIVTVPYNPTSPQGGTERFCHQVLVALRNQGHDAQMFCPADTNPNVPYAVRSDVYSTEHIKANGKRGTDLEGYIKSLETEAVNFDYVLMSSPFTSHSLFKDWKFFKKAALINHLTYPGMITGEGGFRFQLAARWLQQCGGRAFASGDSNQRDMQNLWDTPHKQERIKNTYAQYIERVNLDTTRPLFEGWFDVNLLPDDRAPFTKIDKKLVVAIGRPVREKQIIYATKSMEKLKELGYDCHVFITSIGKDYETIIKSDINVHVNEPHSKIMEYVSKARCLLFPSISETNGIVAFEAASHGVPVIYRCDEPEFFLKRYGLGIKIQPNTQNELVDMMVFAVENVNQSEQERKKIRTCIDNDYSETEFVKRILDIFPKTKITSNKPVKDSLLVF